MFQGTIMNNSKASAFILAIEFVLLCSCVNGANKADVQSPMESNEAFIELANTLLDSTSTFNDVYGKASRFYDIAIEMSKNKDSKRDRILAQNLTSNTLWDVLDKGSGENEIAEKVGVLIDKAGLVANQWIYEEQDGEAHLFHDTYFMSYKETEYETDDSFTIEVLFPRNEAEGYVVVMDLPESAVFPMAILFTKEVDGEEDRESSVLAEWKDVIPRDEDDLQLKVLSDEEILSLMLEYDHMYFFFETEKKTADGRRMDSGRITLEPFKDMFHEITDKE